MATNILTFASIWALEELALQEIQSQIKSQSFTVISTSNTLTRFREVDSAVKLHYEPTGHLLAIQSNTSHASQVAIARLVRDYLERHRSDNLLEAPRLRQVASVGVENVWVEKDESRLRDENANPSLIPNDDAPVETNVIQRWKPAPSALKYFEHDQFKLLQRVAAATNSEIVNEQATAKGFLEIQGDTYGEAQQAMKKLSILQPALALVDMPFSTNMVIATANQTQEYHVMTYQIINKISLSRLLFDPKVIPLPWILSSRAPVTWKFRMEERIWGMLDKFCYPPTLEAAGKHEPETMEIWKDFVFRQLGDNTTYSSFPSSAFHPPKAVEGPPNADAPSNHPFLNPEKAKDVNKWVSRAQNEVNGSTAATSSPSGIAFKLDPHTPGPRDSSTASPEPPVIQRSNTSNAKRAPVAGVKIRKPMTVETHDARLTVGSTAQLDDTSSASSAPSLNAGPPESIKSEENSSGDSASPDPAPNSSRESDAGPQDSPESQIVSTDELEDSINSIIQKKVQLETLTVVPVASKHDPEDLIDLSDTEINLPASPKPQPESSDPPKDSLIDGLQPAPAVPRASLGPELQLPKAPHLLDFPSLALTLPHTAPGLTGDKNVSNLESVLSDIRAPALSEPPSQNTGPEPVTSAAETAIYLPGYPLTDAPLGDQPGSEDSLTDSHDTARDQQVFEAADNEPEPSSHPLALSETLISPSVSTNLPDFSSVARKYLLSLCSAEVDSVQDNPFSVDGSFDGVPQAELPGLPGLEADSLRSERACVEGNESLRVGVDTREFHSLMKQRAPNTLKYDKPKAHVLRKQYAETALIRNTFKRTLQLEKIKSPALRSEPAETPKKEIPSADTEQVKGLFGILKPVLDPLTSWPGALSLEIQFGLMLLPGGPKREDIRLELDGLKRFLAPRGLAAPSVTFLDRLTTSPVDMNHVVDLQVNDFRLFEKDSLYAEVLFEFHCERGPSHFIITVFENGTHMVSRPETLLGAVYLNFPSSVWDASLKICGQINQVEDEETLEAARFIAKNLYIEPNCSHVRLLTRQPKGFKIVKVLMRRSTEHQHLQSEYPEGSEEMYLKVCETQDLIIQVTDLDDEVIHAHCDPLAEMTKAHRQWWTASLVSPILNTYLSSNKYLSPGEKTTDWAPVDLFGCDARLLAPSSELRAASPSTGTRLTYPSRVATAIGGTGIDGLVKLAEVVVKQIDAVGSKNKGPAAGIPKTPSSRSRVSENVIVVRDRQIGVPVPMSRVPLTPTRRNSPAPGEKLFW